jgi:hypothetical protein
VSARDAFVSAVCAPVSAIQVHLSEPKVPGMAAHLAHRQNLMTPPADMP